MKIGIIGAGNIGGNLTRRLTALGHDVSVANSPRSGDPRGPRAPRPARPPVRSRRRRAARTSSSSRSRRRTSRSLPAGPARRRARCVVDTGNYYPQQRDGRIAAIEDGHARVAVGRRTSSACRSSRRSTASTPRTCSPRAARPATPGAAPCRSPATTAPPRRPSSRCSTSSASTPSTPARSPSPGASSRARRSYGAAADAAGIRDAARAGVAGAHRGVEGLARQPARQLGQDLPERRVDADVGLRVPAGRAVVHDRHRDAELARRGARTGSRTSP